MEANYHVELHFSGVLTNEQKDQICGRILDILVTETNTGSIVPDDAEEFTTYICVRREENSISLAKDIMSDEYL